MVVFLQKKCVELSVTRNEGITPRNSGYVFTKMENGIIRFHCKLLFLCQTDLPIFGYMFAHKNNKLNWSRLVSIQKF